MNSRFEGASVLVVGEGKLVNSVTACLLLAGHRVTLLSGNKSSASEEVAAHLAGLAGFQGVRGAGAAEIANSLEIVDALEIKDTGNRREGADKFIIGIAVTEELSDRKLSAIRQLEKYILAGSPVAINTESIPLDVLQAGSRCPENLIGLNWVEPAHTTFFLELIVNERTDKALADDIFQLGRMCWKKDPYLLSNSISIRARMLSGMVREAFYLVQNGYATIEDIDRACRNDAGYYLPFAGNFRYMDLMGTYAYGLVMKDLNRELSTDTSLPPFLEHILDQGGRGMENNSGFYGYEEGEAKQWNEIFRSFSHQIKHIIEKYPFNYKQQ